VRLHSLELAGVGPFRGRQKIDFDAVSASGLFLIEGPTGAGKTTILDAIVYALYGSLSGAESDASRMRSQLCDSDERTEITLEFSIGGVRHTITRNPPYERRKARGEGTTVERAAQTLRVHDDAIPDMREAREMGIYLQQRIGLTADQFRRLVVLPQGEFDTLLRAKPRDRYDTVAALIDDGYLQRVQEDLRRQAEEAQQTRAAAEAAVSRILGVMRERAAEVVATDDDFDPDAVIADISARSTTAHEAATVTKAALEAAQAHEHAVRVRAEAALAARTVRAALDQASAHAGAEIASLDDAGLQALSMELVAQRTRLEPVAAWEADADVRDRESARLHTHAATLAQRIAEVRSQAAALPARKQEAQAALAEAQSLADAAGALEGEVTWLEGLQSSFAEREGLAYQYEGARARLASAGESLQEARNVLQVARTEQHALVSTQLDQRAAHLASLLVPGASCPVCGSLEHPSPAHDTIAAALVSDADVADAEQRSARAERVEAEAAAAVDSARSSVAALEQQLAVIDTRLEGVTADTVAATLAEARAGLQRAQAAADRLAALAESVAALDAETAASASTIEALVADEATAQAEARAYDAAVAAETERHRAEIGDVVTAAEALAAIGVRLATVEALRTARAAAAGQPVDADPAAAEAALAQATRTRTQAEVQHAEADQVRLRLADAHAALASHAAELGQARARLDAVGQNTEAVIRLGDLVTARSAANRRRLTLQAYAVQRRFQSVLEAASVHLERMSSGKFTFVIDDQAAGRAQSGLGIDILDAWTGRTRDPESLSGGETFYASLSLALGLADLVREESGGVSLDTLFVDEGFGSLDADTLTVVLDQLDALRSRGRVVGVISHVAEMKEWVHDRIRVAPGQPGAGSTISQTG
jgi:exonuclease SbcC